MTEGHWEKRRKTCPVTWKNKKEETTDLNTQLPRFSGRRARGGPGLCDSKTRRPGGRLPENQLGGPTHVLLSGLRSPRRDGLSPRWVELGIRADQPGTWSALEHYRLWGHWGEEDWSGASSGRTGVSSSVLGVEAELFHSGAQCATSRVCAGRGRGRELKHCVLLVPAGGILHAPQARRSQRSHMHRGHQSHNTCLSHPTSLLWPCPPFLRNGLPSASWPFHWPLGEPFPRPTTHSNLLRLLQTLAAPHPWWPGCGRCSGEA